MEIDPETGKTIDASHKRRRVTRFEDIDINMCRTTQDIIDRAREIQEEIKFDGEEETCIYIESGGDEQAIYIEWRRDETDYEMEERLEQEARRKAYQEQTERQRLEQQARKLGFKVVKDD